MTVSRPEGAHAIAAVARATLAFLAAFETVQRRMHPPEIPALRAWLAREAAELESALAGLRALTPSDALAPLVTQLGAAAGAAHEAARAFLEPAPPAEAAPRILASFRHAAHALEALYPLRRVIPPAGLLFAEAPLHGALDTLDPPTPDGVSVGLHRAGPPATDGRGGFTLYVPETYDAARPLPLVVALHGAFGHGREFLWTWLREARSRRALVLAPTSPDTTWSLHRPERDVAMLFAMVGYVRERWEVDPARILVTGLSDGGTFALLAGLADGAPFTHLAPVAGVLHPLCLRDGRLEGARGKPIRLVHGALDWMFPVALARLAKETLEGAGAALVYREIEDLSHTYPREENARILRWMDPALALPGEA
jgi:phospholipase/carboxylesterase